MSGNWGKNDIIGIGTSIGINVYYTSKANSEFVSYNPEKGNCIITRTSSKHIDGTLCKINSEEIKITYLDPFDRKLRKYTLWRYKKT